MIDLDIKVRVNKYNINIENSYTVDDKSIMNYVINDLRNNFKSEVLENRSNLSMINEWVGNNNLYKLHIMRSHTKDVDLDYHQKWYYKLAWFLLGVIRI